MNAKTIDIKTADGSCDCYIAYPEGRTNLPLVLFYMDAVGLRPRIYDMVKTVAEKGYYVIAPNIFYRSHKAPIVDYDKLLNPAGLPELFKQVIGMAASLTPEMARRDAEAYFEFAGSQAEVDAKNVGAVGYCMGGAMAIRASAFFPDRIKAVASYHAGRLASDLPSSPHLLAEQIKARLYVAHADNDQSMPLQQIQAFEEALKAAKVNFKSEIYKAAVHGFTMSDLPAYSQEAEERHWQSLFALFEAEL